jgi:HEAT repeat protein
MIARLTIALLLGAAATTAAQGRIANARTETRSAARGLDRELRAVAGRSGVTWTGYRMPMIAGPRNMCCYDTVGDAGDCCGTCRLERGSGVTMTTGDTASRGTRIALEPPTEFLVLARYEGGTLTRIRTFTPDCDVDAGGLPLVWLDDVKPDDSVAWLTSIIGAAGRDAESRNRIAKPAIAALSLHTARSALTSLLTLARSNPDTHVRSDALFWLAQRAGQEAVAAITNAILDDPETEVKKRAVFALSQLPKDEGVPKLIDVARNNRNPEVRKQAFFWLGQTKDPRAMQLFEEILLRK